MWSVVLVSLLFRASEVYGQNAAAETTQVENKTESFRNLNELIEKLNEVRNIKLGSVFDNLDSLVGERVEEKSTRVLSDEDGRRLKYKKTELKFLMKLLIILKVVLGLVLPLGIIASKILSWKAVTLSLMAFMLAKILFIKNLLTGKNAYSVAPANIVPPFLIHGSSHDFWKRQGDAQNVYPWNST